MYLRLIMVLVCLHWNNSIIRLQIYVTNFPQEAPTKMRSPASASPTMKKLPPLTSASSQMKAFSPKIAPCSPASPRQAIISRFRRPRCWPFSTTSAILHSRFLQQRMPSRSWASALLPPFWLMESTSRKQCVSRSGTTCFRSPGKKAAHHLSE